MTVRRSAILLTAVACCLGVFCTGAELLNTSFPENENLFESWSMPEDDRAEIGKSIHREGAFLRTGNRNLLLYRGEANWRDYTVTLEFERKWPNAFALLGRINPGAPYTHYYLEVVDKPGKALRLGRMVDGKGEVLSTLSFPAGFDGKRGTLALRFAGNKVTALANGQAIAEAVDDGRIKSGSVGVKGEFYTNVGLISLKVEDSAIEALNLASFHLAAGDRKSLEEKKIRFEPDNLLATDQSNALLTTGQPDWRAERVDLEFERLWPNDFALVARQNAQSEHTYYFLTVRGKEKELVLGRSVNAKIEVFATAPYPEGFDGSRGTVSLLFRDGKIVGLVNGDVVAAAADDGTLPAGRCGIRAGYYTRLKVKSFLISEGTGAAFKKNPSLKVDWSLQRAYRETDGMRERISLNELWNFSPADPGAEAPGDWGFFMVPGHWRGGNISNRMRDGAGKPVALWNGKEVTKYPLGFYRRSFVLPVGWDGQVIEIYFENLKGKPRLQVNGREVFRSDLDDNNLRVDISAFLHEGENELLLLLDGSAPAKAVPRNGIFGNAWLEKRPGVNLGFPRILPSVTKKQLTVHLPGNASSGTVEIEISQKVKKRFLVNAENVYQFSFLPEELWTPENPVLLDAVFTLRDGSGRVLDRCARRFGFREFSLAGGDFLLNGKPYLLRFDTAVQTYWSPDWHFNETYIRNQLKSMKALNLNGLYMAQDAPDKLYALLNEVGFLALAKGIPTPHTELNRAKDDPEWWNRFEAAVKRAVENPARFNHPSLIGYLVDVWYNYHSGAQNPEYAGMSAELRERPRIRPDGTIAAEKFNDPNMNGFPALRKETLDRIIGIYGKYAPELEFFCGASGHAGRMYSTHLYHTWGAPESEMRAFFERWEKERELPVFGGEILIPYIGSFYEIDKWFGGGNPLFFENAARRMGPRAYTFTPVTTERPFHEKGEAGVMSQFTIPDGKGPRIAFPADQYTELVADSIERLFLPWRTADFQGFGSFETALGAHYALAGYMTNAERPPLPENLATPGYKPELFDQYNAVTLSMPPVADDPAPYFTEAALPLRRAFAERAFWIAGAPDLYNDDHAFYGGEVMKKQLILFNSGAVVKEQKVVYRILDADGRQLGGETHSAVRVPAYGKLSVPLEISLPEVAVRSEFRLSVAVDDETGNFDFQLFPEARIDQPARPLYVLDPEGRLKAFLKQRRIAFQEMSGELPEGALLIVGRNTVPPEVKGNILILEQPGEHSSELMKVRSREAFIYDALHPVLAGFRDVDFTLWRGNAGLVPAYGSSSAGQNWNGFGNRNMLAAHVWRRPCIGSWKSLLVNGFNLHQSPLMESVEPERSVISCQLDITERLGGDPVATTLFGRMLDYLDRRGLIVEKNTMVISAPDFSALEKRRNEIAEFVYRGGKVLYLHNGGTFSPRWLPFALELTETETRQALLPDSFPARGWGNAELFFGTPFRIPVFHNFNRGMDATSPAVVVRRKFGQGEYLFCSVSPALFGDTPAAAGVSRLISALKMQAGVTLPAEFPFQRHESSGEFDLTDLKWDFRLDPDDRGMTEKWHENYSPAGWLSGLIADGLEVRLGMPFEAFLGRNYDGVAWYRISVEIPEGICRNARFCHVGAIDDTDEIYVNGIKIGSTGTDTPRYWETERLYPLPAGLLKPGRNLIAVRVTDLRGEGGIVRGPFRLIDRKPEKAKGWNVPPAGTRRDYEYNADLVRMY